MNCLIVGGSSGLGLELAKQLIGRGEKVWVTGRTDPQIDGLPFIRWYLDEQPFGYVWLDQAEVPIVDLLVYAAGFAQQAALTKLSPNDIEATTNLGLVAPINLLRYLLLEQGGLGGFIPITSTSASTPRPNESIYCAVKAGLDMFARSMALDPRVAHTLVVAPAGMNSPFWRHDRKDTSGWLDPAWVAGQIRNEYVLTKRYRSIKILRDPPRVELVEVSDD